MINTRYFCDQCRKEVGQWSDITDVVFGARIDFCSNGEDFKEIHFGEMCKDCYKILYDRIIELK